MPLWVENYTIIDNVHIKLANRFGFYIIDVHTFYDKKDLKNFGIKIDPYHQMSVIMRNLGKNIAKSIDKFKFLNKQIENLSLPDFKVLAPNEMVKHGNFNIFNPINSMFNEIVYRLENNNYLSIEGYENWNFIGLHSWNLEHDGSIPKKSWNVLVKTWGKIIIKNDNYIVKNMPSLIQMSPVISNVKIKHDTILKVENNNLDVKEYFILNEKELNKMSTKLPYFDLIGILICSPYDEKTLLNIDEIPDNEIIKIEPELDFTHLVPNVEFFRDSMEFIDEYAPRLYGGIEKHIQAKFINALNAKIESLENENRILKSTYPSAIKRVQNHLSYKLGRAMIENSKSIFGYFKMPFVLWSIKKDHKLTKKINEILSLPKIETLSDYKEALKYKNHLSYKLGAAIMKATKTWYKGGFIKLIFEIQKIKKEHKK